eukprot:scaffold18152_cov88-Phaeocystis_antarctica.AAC.3
MLCSCQPLGAWHRRHRRDVGRGHARRALCPTALPRRHRLSEHGRGGALQRGGVGVGGAAAARHLVHAQRRRHPLLTLTAPLPAAGLQRCRIADLRGMHELTGELAPLDQPAARAHRVDLVEEIEHRRQQQHLWHARRHCDRRRVAAEKEEEVVDADADVTCASDGRPVALQPLELLTLHRQQQLCCDNLLLREGDLRRRQQVRLV